MMADRAGQLIESQLVGNLNPPPRGDFSWVKAGKTSWDWWSGPLEGVKPDLAAYKRFIDFAAESGFPYHLMDAGWAFGTGPCCDPLPTTDITRAPTASTCRPWCATPPTRPWACCCGCTGSTWRRGWTRCWTPTRAGASRASRSTS
ncbi:glycoside hydrolase family 97 catalytic domain-containing protein [Mitsuaria sp. TWR114]|uniref:glycoside hydrolase family 97 catalytic domain-containing protein n=1 Tax=Mitsuaria sp. TWR114 TaxID=2601731 RepID=UPI0021034C4B|nr:glycoside hydrolase family 97 catalytic domain-containing protein [Mitsuaria sp. TWR114]